MRNVFSNQNTASSLIISKLYDQDSFYAAFERDLGRVTKGSLDDPSILNLFDAVVISDEDIDDAVEIATVWSKGCANTSIIITKAREGATLLQDGKCTDIPTARPLGVHEIVDSVGAGDMFSAEIAVKLFEGASAEQAIEFAHTSTARMLTTRRQQDL
jgi:sugar/nucleoside kinase (ribokinase family)